MQDIQIMCWVARLNEAERYIAVIVLALGIANEEELLKC